MSHTNRTATLGALAMIICLGAPSLVWADPITVGDGWHQFSWTGSAGVFNNESPFTFNSASSVDLKVTDAFVSGDRFEVYDFGVLVGTTSQVNGFAPWTSDPNVAYPSGGFSTGLYSLAAGNHSLTFKTIQEPSGYPSGTAFFRVDSSGSGQVADVPEPGALMLAALGLAGLAIRGVRQRVGAVAGRLRPARANCGSLTRTDKAQRGADWLPFAVSPLSSPGSLKASSHRSWASS